MSNGKERIIGLDLVRAIAILSVVLAHSSPVLSPLCNVPYAGKFFQGLLANEYPMSVVGVELFFVLSGFLIGGILIRTYVNAENFSFRDVRNFWIRRWFRTLPNYWLILTVDIVLYVALRLTPLDRYKLLFYVFLQNLWYPHPPFFFGEAWSLSVEEWFYLTLPVCMLAAFLIFRPRDKKAFLFRVFLFYLLAFLTARFVNAFHPLNGPDQDVGIRKVVVFRLDAVMYGVLIAYFNFYKKDKLKLLRFYLLVISLAGTAAIYYLIESPVSICNPANATLKFLSDAFLYLFLPLFLSLCLPCAFYVRSLPGKHFSRVVRHISKISYSMYLVHYSLIYCPIVYYWRISTPLVAVLFYVAYWAVVIGLSTVIYWYLEFPVMQLREKFSQAKIKAVNK